MRLSYVLGVELWSPVGVILVQQQFLCRPALFCTLCYIHAVLPCGSHLVAVALQLLRVAVVLCALPLRRSMDQGSTWFWSLTSEVSRVQSRCVGLTVIIIATHVVLCCSVFVDGRHILSRCLCACACARAIDLCVDLCACVPV